MAASVKTVPNFKPKYRPDRTHDYLYDSNHVVSSQKDHMRCVVEAFKREAEYKICPMYRTMFSDLRRYPPAKYVLKKTSGKTSFHIDKSWKSKQKPVLSSDKNGKSVKFDSRRRSSDRKTFESVDEVPSQKDLLVHVSQGEIKPPKLIVRTRGTQTKYRESEAQTDPWAPPYCVKGKEIPEILTLTMLTWGNGLPPGVHEVEIIERLRRRRAWEKALETTKNLEKQRDILEAMEREAWLFREEEIQAIHELRLELAKRMLLDFDVHCAEKLQEKLNRIEISQTLEKEAKIKSINHQRMRDLRKLTLKYKGVNKKYHSRSPIDEHADKTSELYAPQLRFGENPSRRHEEIHVNSRFMTSCRGLDILEMTEDVVKKFNYQDHFPKSQIRPPYIELCVRETRWTEDVLAKLYDDLKGLRMKHKEKSITTTRLMVKVEKPVVEQEVSRREGPSPEEEEAFQVSLFFQKIVKGRAIQLMMHKGKEMSKGLIEELKSTYAFNEAGKLVKEAEMRAVKLQQRTRSVQINREKAVTDILCQMEGKTIGVLLDFLTKELLRLQDERGAHALALLAERERHRREAAEAGRRQAEERRRREHDELFKQFVKVNQDSIDIYLEDIILDSMDQTGDEEARAFVKDKAKQIDKAAWEAHERNNYIEQQELIGDLILNFMVPEVEKQMVREKIKRRQKKHLEVAHSVIYGHLERNIFDPESYAEKYEAMHNILLEILEKSYDERTAVFLSKEIIEGLAESIEVSRDILQDIVQESSLTSEEIIRRILDQMDRSITNEIIIKSLVQVRTEGMQIVKDIVKKIVHKAVSRTEGIKVSKGILELILKEVEKKIEEKEQAEVPSESGDYIFEEEMEAPATELNKRRICKCKVKSKKQ